MSSTEEPPGPRRLPVVGNTHQWIRDPCGTRERWAERYGDVVGYRVLDEDLYMVTDHEEIGRILIGESDRFEKTDAVRDYLDFVLGDGLLLSRGELWERQRSLIQEAFYPGRIREYVEGMTARADGVADRWEAGDVYDVKSEMRSLTLRVLVGAMFGADVDYEGRSIGEAIRAVEEPFRPRNAPLAVATPDWVPLPLRRRAEAGVAHLESVIDDLIERRRASDAERSDLLGMLLRATDEAGEGMSDEQLRDEMMTMFFAGHETTALALTYTWHLLARNPHVERTLHAELDRVLGGRPATFGDLGDLEYTEKVIKESLRLYPPVHEMRRQATEPVDVGGYRFPGGTTFTLPQWVMHRDGRFFSRPDEFRPERWTREFERDLPTFAYFPFGGGERVCIGRRFSLTEARIVVATVASRYRLELVEPERLDLLASITLHPDGEILMRPRER